MPAPRLSGRWLRAACASRSAKGADRLAGVRAARLLLHCRPIMTDIVRISPVEASQKLSEGWTYVDVRTTQEFEAGHPAGALNVPIAHREGPNPDFIRVMKANFPTDAKIVVGCKSGTRSQRAAQALVAEGFTNILDQRAGWDGTRSPFGEVAEAGWVLSGLPREDGAPAGRSWPDLRSKATG
jgi:rhodanese-related sulfurtransferase